MHLQIHIPLVFLIINQAHPYRFDFVVNLTKSLSERYNFSTFVVFRNGSACLRNVKGSFLEKELQRQFDIPLVVSDGDISNTTRFRRHLNVQSLGFVIMNELTDTIRETSDVTLTKLHDMKMIFIVTDPQASVNKTHLDKFFWWCWNVNFLNVIVTFVSGDGIRNKVFTYNPFPDRVDVINLTSIDVKRYFWSKVANVKGYKFATPVFIDEPLVMKFYDEKKNHTRITGTAGRLYKEFLRHINATFFLINVSNTSLHLHQKHVVKLTTDRVIHVSIHPYTYLLPYETDGSYPIAHTNACIILPVVPEIDLSYYVIYAFNQRMWKIILGLFIAFLAIELIANYTFEQQILIGQSMQSTIAGMINQPWKMSSSTPPPAPASPVAGRRRTKALVSSLLLFTGFFVSNLYVGALTSLYSTTVYGNQPESVEDILRTQLEILLLDYEEKAYFETGLFPQALRKRVRITDPDTLANHRNRLNTTFAYIVKEERWKMINYQQSRLWKPIFKIARDFCIPNMFLSFPIQFDSPFYEVLKSFTLNVDSAGLYLQWSEMSYFEAREVGLIGIMKETRQHPTPLGMEHLKLVFIFIGVCYGFCFACLLGENYVEVVRRRNRK